MPQPEKTATPAAAPVCGSEFEEEDVVGKEQRVTASFHFRGRWRRRYPANDEDVGKGMKFEGYFRYIH